MQSNQQPSDELIARFLAGEVSATERMEVELWANDSEENAAELKRLQQIFNTPSKAETQTYNTDAAWKKVKPRLTPDEVPVVQLHPKKSNKRWIAIAAASVAVLAGLFVIFNNRNATEITYNQTIESGSSPKEVVLPDSSIVMLKPQSTLSYVEGFEGNERRLRLEGSARFVVRKNPSKPFIVESRGSFVRVLGTTFLVENSISKNETIVQVEEGKVLLSEELTNQPKNDSSAVVLEAGKSGSINDEHKVQVQSIDPKEAAFSFDQTIVFENTDLKSAIGLLSKFFGKEIQLVSENIANCRLTATFRHQGLQEILQIIATTFNLEVKEENGVRIISGNGC
jgi:transmembrane sensor